MTAHGSAHDQAPEHEFEAAPGLPEPLPAGERLLWQGAPDWRLLARDAFHLRALAGYFALLLTWRGATVASSGGTLIDAAEAVVVLLPLAGIALGLVALLAWLASRTTVYTLTDKRVVMRIGIVLSVTFNLPYSQIDGAALRATRDGSGDLSLLLGDADRIAYLHLWPHARPWHVRRTQPTLRALRDARAVAETLAAALADSAGLARAGLPASAQPLRPSAAGAANAGQHPLAA